MENNKKRIKIISVVTRIAMDSAGKQAILITDNLHRERYETLLVTGSCENNEVDMSLWADQRAMRHVKIPEMKREIRLHLDFIAFLKLLILFLREKPDIVHTRTAKAGCLGRIAAKLAGVPVVIHTFDGHVFNGYFPKFKTMLILTIERILTRFFTDRLIAISNMQKKELLNFLRIKNPDKIRIVHIGLDFDEFKSPFSCEAFKKELGLSEDDLLVGYVGRLAPIKRVDRLISAWVKVAERVPKAKFVIVGDGELRNECEDMVKLMCIEKKVFFLGVRQDMEKIYPGVDMLAMSSDNEGTPAVLIEALSYGTPVVSTNVGGIPDVITNGVSGLLTDANGASELADSIVRMLNDEEMRKRMGKKGNEEVRRKFSLENLVENLDGIYINELANKSPNFHERFAETMNSR